MEQKNTLGLYESEKIDSSDLSNMKHKELLKLAAKLHEENGGEEAFGPKKFGWDRKTTIKAINTMRAFKRTVEAVE